MTLVRPEQTWLWSRCSASRAACCRPQGGWVGLTRGRLVVKVGASSDDIPCEGGPVDTPRLDRQVAMRLLCLFALPPVI
jgi:hypothetical protein